jgi:hypothetical protein
MSLVWCSQFEALLPLLERASPHDLDQAADQAAVLLEAMRSDPSLIAEQIDLLSRLRRLGTNAATLYHGWLSITAERTAGYDNSGAPVPLGLGSVSIEV